MSKKVEYVKVIVENYHSPSYFLIRKDTLDFGSHDEEIIGFKNPVVEEIIMKEMRAENRKYSQLIVFPYTLKQETYLLSSYNRLGQQEWVI